MTDQDAAARSSATDEPWTRHRVGATGICEECDQSWPCDIAKAWRHGYQWAQVERRVGELRARSGRPVAHTEKGERR